MVKPSVLIELLTVVRHQDNKAVFIEAPVSKKIQKGSKLAIRVPDLSVVQGAQVSPIGGVLAEALRKKDLRRVKSLGQCPGLSLRKNSVFARWLVRGMWIDHMNEGEHRTARFGPIEHLLPEKTAGN